MSAPYSPITNIVPWTQIIAGLNQSIYSTNWTATDPTDVLVYVRASGIPANDIAQLVPTNQYTVQQIGPQNVIQITFGNSYIPAQYSFVTIMRNTPSQFINLYTNTNFTPSMLNGDFENLTEVDQQNQLYWQQIVPRYNNSATVNVPIDTILPVLGANQFWIKNSTNTAFIPATIGDSGEFPVLGPFVLFATDSNYPEGFSLGSLATGMLAQNTVLGISTPFSIPFPLAVNFGGTGNSSFTPYALLLGATTSTNPIAQITDIGDVGEVLTSGGPGQPPSFQPVTPPYFGTVVSSLISAALATSISSATPTNLTSIILPAGNWLIFGNTYFISSGSPSIGSIFSGINSTSATLPDNSLNAHVNIASSTLLGSQGIEAPTQYVHLTVQTTFYLVNNISFSGGTYTQCGGLTAIQMP